MGETEEALREAPHRVVHGTVDMAAQFQRSPIHAEARRQNGGINAAQIHNANMFIQVEQGVRREISRHLSCLVDREGLRQGGFMQGTWMIVVLEINDHGLHFRSGTTLEELECRSTRFESEFSSA